MSKDRVYENRDGIGVHIYREFGPFWSRRWTGIAYAEWGSVGAGRGYRSKRRLKRKLIEHMERRRPTVGKDVPGVLQAAAEGVVDSPNSNLREIDLNQRDLSNSNFSNSNFAQAVLSGANLQEADLSFCNFPWVDFARAALDGADLTCAAFYNSNLAEASLRQVHHAGTFLEPAVTDYPAIRMESWVGFLYFWSCDLTNCDFGGADLRGAGFADSDLTGADFTDAALEAARFINCTIDEATLSTLSNQDCYVGPPREDRRYQPFG